MDIKKFQKDSAQVISDGLAETEFPVAVDKIRVAYAEGRGLTQVFVESEAITNNRNARLALRQAIGQNLVVEYMRQSDAFSESASPDGVRVDRAIEQGPPMKAGDGSPSMLYQFRDPKTKVDLTPFIALIDPSKIGQLFRDHYLSGPNPDAGTPTITTLE